MDQHISHYLRGLKEYGLKNDIPNVTEEVGRFLNMLITIKQPKNILEIGCANGYSTIWMAEAASKIGAKVHTIDHSAPTFEEGKKNLNEVRLDSSVVFYFGDAVEVIRDMPSDLMFEFIFVDGQKASYLDFWEAIKPRLNDKAVIIFDDMIAFPKKTRPFTEALKKEAGFDRLLIPIDNDDGILLLTKN